MSKGSKIFLGIVGYIAWFIVIGIISYIAVGLPVFRGKNLRVPFDGDTSRSQVVDERGVLSSGTLKSLNAQVQEYSGKLGMNIVIYVSGSARYDNATPDFTANTYDSLMGEEFTDGVLYYMDFSGKVPAYDYLSCSGKACVIYGQNPSDITDKVVPYLPPSSKKNITEDDVVPGIEHFLIVLEDYDSNYEQDTLTYTEDDQNHIYFFDTGSEFYCTKRKAPGARFPLFVGSLALGTLVTSLIYFITKSNYKFKNKTNASIYVANGKTSFSERSDTFIRSYVTKTKIESSSGGGGGGHHGGGGHSGGHVGGGSHR